MYERILVPVDGSEPSIRALEEALAMALGRRPHAATGIPRTPAARAALKAIHVLDDALDQSELVAQGQAVLARSIARAAEVGIAPERAMPPAAGRLISDVILEEALHFGADLIVMGSHGHSGLREALLGSVAKEVIRNSTVPVLLPGRPPSAGRPTGHR